MSEEWQSFLERVSQDVLQEPDEFAEDLPAGAAESGWLGAAGATEEEIAEAEQRLGIALPSGYRAFLETTNGFGPVGLFVRRLRPVQELAWLGDEDPELVAIWAEEGEDRLAPTLVVSDAYDDARVLLNPGVRDEAGEWRAWFFAHWVPGAQEFGSFRELLEHSHDEAVAHLKAERGEPTPRVAPELGVAADDLEGLVEALARPTPGERVLALEALGNLRDGRAASAVAARLRDPTEDEWVRTTAARTLGQLRHPGSVAALVDVLRLPYPQGRLFDADRRSDAQEAMIGLKHAAKQGLLGPPLRELAEPAVRALLRDPDPDLRAEARQLLVSAHSWRDA